MGATGTVAAMRVNEHGQPIGDPVEGWSPRPRPGRIALTGRLGSLVPIEDHHVPALFDALAVHAPEHLWTYMPVGPFPTLASFEGFLAAFQALPDAEPMAILDTDGRPVGQAMYLRIDEANGSAEVGAIAFRPALQRTALATEAMVLMARHVFEDLGYRRYEWKCDVLNQPSLDAATRLGFTFEGTFRQAMVNKGRNRDTSWLSITDGEWAQLRPAFDAWLDPANFDEDGTQRTSLSTLTRAALAG